jgi:hypothetical protein
MTSEQFNTFWALNFADTIPIQHYFKRDYSDRWFRIHSLPKSKRYADNEGEWNILLDRQNKIITDLLGNTSNFILVTGGYSSQDSKELHPIEEVNSIAKIPFVLLDPIDLNKMSPDEYEAGQFYKPMFSEQIWQPDKFDSILKDIANDQLRAFFISVDEKLIIAPYDGGVDFILKDTETRNMYKQKYSDWLSLREDGL